MLVTKPSLKKIPQPLATDILQRYEQDRALQKWVDPSLTPVAFINRLAGETMHQELVIFLSHSLLALECIWWGYLCIEKAGIPLSETEQKALDVVRRWLQEPIEIHRRLAEITAQQAGLDNACGWLAQGVFWSGGSLTPVNGPQSPAPSWLYAHAVAGAICLAAVLPDGRQGNKRYRQFIAMGIDIADGGKGS
ncbi:hypothetical protein [Endozoicomonas sp. GU-1]|uniref:DUF6931 family protein n=1 Tax=Endozoicomonas sp. GU-1 TaxID=3009078 RepID=UPI0022B2DC24|nr:hypothetical protein [Endozoicomonas sp. GU-1]WBA83891.1 hypothetical protein O2T12_12595 [Endozoicomonas sp. GU-1]